MDLFQFYPIFQIRTYGFKLTQLEFCMFKHLFQYVGVSPSDDEKKVIEALKNNGTGSMKVIGRGTLVMDAKDVTSSKKYKDLLAKADKIVQK